MSKRVGVGQRRIEVTPELIELLFVEGGSTGLELPEDARFVRLWAMDTGRGYVLVFESKEWDELEEGEEIPLITPEPRGCVET